MLYDALRGLKRPEQLAEPLGQQGAAVTVGYVAAGPPLLVVSTLHGDDGVDGTTVSFLLAQNLKLKEEEEEGKERRRKLREEAKHKSRMREFAAKRPASGSARQTPTTGLSGSRSRSASPHGRRGAKGSGRRGRNASFLNSLLLALLAPGKPGHCSLRPLRLWQFLCLGVVGSTGATCSRVSSRGFRFVSRFSSCWWTLLLRSILRAFRLAACSVSLLPEEYKTLRFFWSPLEL